MKIQAFIRMKVQRKNFRTLLTEKKVQYNMDVQLQDLQSRLHDEQRRNAQLKKERDSATRDSILFAESDGTRSRGKSTAHLWMADADGILSQLHDDANRLRRENEEQRDQNASLKNEVEKLKSEKEVLAANMHVKVRQYEDTVRAARAVKRMVVCPPAHERLGVWVCPSLQVREKDKRLAVMEKELRRLREIAGVANVNSAERPRSTARDRSKSIFRTLGSKKDHRSESYGGDFDRSSQAMQSSLAQKSADTAQFLKASAQRMTRAKFWGSIGEDEPDRLSGGDRKSLLQGVGAAGVGAMSTLKGKITAVKGKYYGDGMADPLGRPGADSSHLYSLDGLSDASLPPGWEARLSRSKGKVYFCNPTLKLTQWDRPTVESLKARKLTAGTAQRARQCVLHHCVWVCVEAVCVWEANDKMACWGWGLTRGSKLQSPGRESMGSWTLGACGVDYGVVAGI